MNLFSGVFQTQFDSQRYETSIENLLNTSPLDTPEWVPFVIDAFNTIKENRSVDAVNIDLQSRVKKIKEFLDNPPQNETHVSEFKDFVLKRIAAKIEDLRQAPQVPTFTDDPRKNRVIYDALKKLKGNILETTVNNDYILDKDIWETVKAFFKSGSQSLLVIGDTGSGKSLLFRWMVRQLIQVHANGIVKDQQMPILIPLKPGDAFNSSEFNPIIRHLNSLSLLDNEIELLRLYDVPLIFFLDGFDGLGVLKNLHELYGFHKWKNYKLVVSCRHQVETTFKQGYEAFFLTPSDKRSLHKITLKPFIKEIPGFVDSYAKSIVREGWKADTYQNYLVDLSELHDLLANPFILKVVLTELPNIVEQHKDKVFYKAMSATLESLFDTVIDKWYQSQYDQYGSRLGTQEDFRKFHQKIATELINNKTNCLDEIKFDVAVVVKKRTKSSKKFWKPSKSEITSEERQIQSFGIGVVKIPLLVSKSESPLEQEENDEEAIFTTLNQVQQTFFQNPVLCSTWLLKKVDDKHSFLSDSLITYFGADKNARIALYQCRFAFGISLNTELIVDKPDALKKCIDILEQDPSLVELLFDVIESSKDTRLTEIAAANAITILNKAMILKKIKASFLDRDLNGIRIPRADLSEAFLKGVKMRWSDLRRVRLYRTCLAEVDLSGSCMDDVQLCEFSPIETYPCQTKINGITAWAFSSDGKWLAIAGFKSVVNIINASDGLLKEELKLESNGPIRALYFSPNHTYLAILSGSSRLDFWHLGSRKWVKEMSLQELTISSLCFSSDDRILAIAVKGVNHRVVLEDFEQRTTLLSFRNAMSVCFDSKSKTAAVGGNNGSINICDLLSEKSLREFKNIGDTSDLFFSADDKLLASVNDKERKKTVWDVTTGKQICSLKGGGTPSQFSPNGKMIIGIQGKHIVLWELPSGRKVFKIRQSSEIELVNFSPDGKTFRTVDTTGRITVWDTPSDQRFQQSIAHTGGVNSINFISGQNIMVSGGDDFTVRLWNMKSEDSILFERLNDSVQCVSLSLDGKFLAAICGNEGVGKLIMWEASSHKVLFTRDNVLSFTFSSDSKMLAVRDSDNTIAVFKIESILNTGIIKGHSFSNKKHFPKFICFSSDNKTIISIDEVKHSDFNFLESNNAAICHWDIESGKLNKKYPFIAIGFENEFTVTQDKIMLAVQCSGAVALYDIPSGNEVCTIKDEGNPVSKICFSPDGQFMIVSKGKCLEVWDIGAKVVLHSLSDYSLPITSIEWDSLGKWLITGDKAGNIRKYLIPENLRKAPPTLVWVNQGTEGIVCKEALITQVTGLSELNYDVLIESLSVGKISQKLSEKIMAVRDRMEWVGDTCKTVFAHIQDISTKQMIQPDLTVETAAVTIAFKEKELSEHVHLIIECIERKKRSIYHVEVFVLDLDRNNNAIGYNRNDQPMYFPKRDNGLAFGKAYIELKPITKAQAEELFSLCSYRSDLIPVKKKNELIELILSDAKRDLVYNNIGKVSVVNGVISLFYSPPNSSIEKGGNCLTYVEDWLEHIGVKFIIEEKKKANTIMSLLDRTSQRSYWNKG